MCQPETLSKQAWQEGEFAVEGRCDDTTDYIRNGMVEKRPASPVVLQGNVLSNVPVPAVVEIDGTAYDTNESTITLDLPIGKYKVKVVAFPYLDVEMEVIV